MADLYASNWDESDASNTTASPDGMPEGMAPSGVNNWGRAAAGAIKRYVNQGIPKTTAGTSTAYTLSYTVAPGALVDGMTHLVQFNAVNGASPTLNVNALGAKPLHFYCGGSWAVCPANMFAIDQVVEVTYNSAAGTYRCIGLPLVLRQSFSAASTVDFTGIPSNVSNLTVMIELRPSADGVGLGLQTYGADGVLDTGVSDYSYYLLGGNSSTGTVSAISGGATAAPLGSNSVDNGTTGFEVTLAFVNIQAATTTKANITSNYLDSVGVNGVFTTGLLWRNEADRITGFRVLISSGGGTLTGVATVVLS